METLSTMIGPDEASLHWWQIAVRGIVVFLFCAILIRVLCRRAFGMQSYLDIALAVLIGSILGRTVTGNAPFVGTLLASVAIAVCYWALIHLAQRFHVVGWLVKGAPFVLVRDGWLDQRAMRAVGISRAHLDEAVRQAHVADLSRVKTAILERSGRISVLPKE
jgi:uncharacterized membrane protein YcaP (DUF421 family)